MNEQPLLRIHVHEHTGTIILNRPQRRNALSRRLLAELMQALGDLHLERRVRAVVIAGAGPAFSAGLDLDEMRATSQQPDPRAQWYEDAVAYQELIEVMLRFPKPLVAAVNGPAVAGGAGLVLACDIVLAVGARRCFPNRGEGSWPGWSRGISHRRGTRRAAAALGRTEPVGEATASAFHGSCPRYLWPRARGSPANALYAEPCS
jgi:enoyl-CoA hydratase/carnithine racemase